MALKEREKFGSRFAVIMAMAGSAIGLGNIWRFPYVVGEHGGAAFIILYLLSCFLLALPIFIAESIIGRRGRSNTYGSIKKLAPGTAWQWLGLLTIVSPIIILSYYSVVGGWSVEYLFKALAFDFTVPEEHIEGFFGRFISSVWEPIIVHTIFILITAGVVLGGVKNGIEKFSKICMPLLFLMIIIIVVYSVLLPGAEKGISYLVKPDFSKLTAQTATAAMGQAFFSLSLGVGTVLTYASYMKEDEKIFASGMGTAVADLLFAILAGFAIMPAVFAAGMEPGAGPGLVFDALPFIFNQMGHTSAPWISAIISIIFFLSILVAALTSAISMMEVGVAYLSEEKGLSRKKAVLLLTVFTWTVGVLCSLSFGPLAGVRLAGNSIFDCLDKLCSNWLLPLGGFLFTLFVGWKMPKPDVRDEFTNRGRCNTRIFKTVYFIMRYFAPVGILILFISNLIF